MLSREFVRPRIEATPTGKRHDGTAPRPYFVSARGATQVVHRVARALVLALLVLLTSAAHAATPDFNRDVRPILSRYCFKCHGPDPQARQGGFRLDVRDQALAAADFGDPAVVPGEAEASNLVLRIFSDDRYEVMPPPETKRSLTKWHKEVLRQWVASRENPLTARVAVNRAWAAFFGRGIVETVEDFGYQGQLPSHPQLLNWLAVEFMEQGWSLKWLHKQIVMSATYRQSSRVTPLLLKQDADNRLLARGPRVRLEAEMIRDAVLRISGLLSPKIGGPSVFPPQPAGVTTEGTYGKLDWKISQGEDRYRRGLYMFSKRTAPFAMFNTFDGPTGESCVARRDVSNTPLQALTLLNDVVFIGAAQQLGREFAPSDGSLQQRIERLFRRLLV